jgi:hypothetical protein
MSKENLLHRLTDRSDPSATRAVADKKDKLKQEIKKLEKLSRKADEDLTPQRLSSSEKTVRFSNSDVSIENIFSSEDDWSRKTTSRQRVEAKASLIKQRNVNTKKASTLQSVKAYLQNKFSPPKPENQSASDDEDFLDTSVNVKVGGVSVCSKTAIAEADSGTPRSPNSSGSSLSRSDTAGPSLHSDRQPVAARLTSQADGTSPVDISESLAEPALFANESAQLAGQSYISLEYRSLVDTSPNTNRSIAGDKGSKFPNSSVHDKPDRDTEQRRADASPKAPSPTSPVRASSLSEVQVSDTLHVQELSQQLQVQPVSQNVQGPVERERIVAYAQIANKTVEKAISPRFTARADPEIRPFYKFVEQWVDDELDREIADTRADIDGSPRRTNVSTAASKQSVVVTPRVEAPGVAAADQVTDTGTNTDESPSDEDEVEDDNTSEADREPGVDFANAAVGDANLDGAVDNAPVGPVVLQAGPIPIAQVVVPQLAQFEPEAEFDDIYDSGMATLNLPFRGNFDEDGEGWLDTINWHVQAQRGLTERAKIAVARMQLYGEARRWFGTLLVIDPAGEGEQPAAHPPVGTIATFEQFRTAFLARFRRPAGELWREQSQLWQCKQKPAQKTEDYLDELLTIAQRARAPDDMVLNAARIGIRDEVRSFVMGQDLPDLNALRKWANVYEMSVQGKRETGDVVERLEILMRGIVDKLQVRPVVGPAVSTARSAPASRSSSPAPKALRFSDNTVTREEAESFAGEYENPWQNTSPRRMDDAAPRDESYGRGNTRGEPPAAYGYRGSGGNRGGFRGNEGVWRQPEGPGQQWNGGTWRGRGRGRGYQGQGNNENPGRGGFQEYQNFGNSAQGQFQLRRQIDCRNCGRTHPLGACPARGQNCSFCGIPNHYATQCYRARAQQNRNQ